MADLTYILWNYRWVSIIVRGGAIMKLELNFENTKVVFSIKGIGFDDGGYY